ncbi:MAG: DUF2924 domain-containing protein [Alphaproteobacteria bacterium]|nr:DUF2924 domain-containing protein [Alphaproteobacteria bacterium]
MNNDVLAQITALQTAPFTQLRKLWRELYKAELPERPNRTWAINQLTYRIQELAWDGETGTLEQRLEAIANTRIRKNLNGKRRNVIQRPLVGTRLSRVYRGIEYQVTVLNDGFAFDGRKYQSLSRIAQIITGKTWSGPAFFGLIVRKEK